MVKLAAIILFVLLARSTPLQSTLKDSVQSVINSSKNGIEWVEKCVEQHPEVLWLADDKVRKTEEGQASLHGTYSEQLFGKKYVEFDRTIMTLHCLKLILDGSENAYQVFTADQPNDTKLSQNSFEFLHALGKRLLKSQWGGMSASQIAQAMETALILGDIGKSEKARELFKSHGVTAPDHDDFYGEALPVMELNPSLCPSFARLPPPAQKLLIKIANLAHYGHVTHLEGGTAMFSKLKQSAIASEDLTALEFDLFVHTCDVAGALGHVNNQSSLVYTELTHKAMQAMADAVCILRDPNKDEWDAYNAYLGKRAAWLELSSNDRADRVLVRIGAMLRLFSPSEGAALKKGMLQLDDGMKQKVISQLDVQKNDKEGRTPTYIPAVLVNLFNNLQLGDSREERLVNTLNLGLPFISRVLEEQMVRLRKNEADPNIPLNFNKIAGYAKTAPDSLKKDFTIDKEGNVSLK